MRLTRLVLENVFQYQYVEVAFGPGMTGIIGPNGSGKSNLLIAIRAALTNDFCLPGVKSDNISQFAKAGDVSRIVLTAVQGDTTFTVCRGLARSTSWLDCGEEPRIEGDKQITQRLALLLGYDLAVVQSLAFVQQGELLASCRETQAATRLSRWQRIFSMGWLETCYSGIGDFLSNYTVMVPTPSSDELAVQEQAKRRELEQLNVAMQALPDFSTYVWEKDDRLLPLKMHKAWKKAKTTLVTTRARRKTVAKEAKTALTQFRTTTVELRVKQAWLDTHAEALVAAREAVARFKDYQLALSAYAAAKNAVDKHTGELAGLVVPKLPTGRFATAVEYATKLSELRTRMAAERDFLSQKTEPICPHCRQVWVNSDVAKQEAAQKVQAYTAEIAALSTEERQMQEYETAQRKYEQRKTAIQSVLKNIVLPVEPVPVSQDVTAEALLQEESIVTARCRTLRLQLQDKTQERVRLEAKRQLAEFARICAVCRRQLSRFKVERAAWQEAKALYQQLRAQKVTYEQLRTQLSIMWHELLTLQQQITATEEKERTVAAQLAFKTELQAAREYFHRDRLPKQLLRERLVQLTESMTQILAKQSQSFSVTISEDLTLQAVFLDGRVQPAFRLSGGQQGKLAVAFWLALSKLIAGVNLLCLDEPTEAMDRENRAGLAAMLDELRTVGSEEGLQCLVITHDDTLRPCFDHVILLKGVGQVEVIL